MDNEKNPPPYSKKVPPCDAEPNSLSMICKFACGFYTFLAVATKDDMSKDGHAEAMSLASCMKKCEDMFRSDPP